MKVTSFIEILIYDVRERFLKIKQRLYAFDTQIFLLNFTVH